MARQQLGTDPANNLDAATLAYVQANKGSGSSGSSNGNLFIQQTNPNMTSPGLWWQIDASGNLVTLWVETATTNAAPTTNLVHRIRASTLTGYSNGGNISSLTVETSNVALNSSSGYNPTYLASGLNSKPAIRFNGGQFLQLATSGSGVNIPQPFSMVMIGNITNISGTQEYVEMNGAELLLNASGAGYNVYNGSLLSGGTPATGGHLIIGSTTGGSATISVDGTVVATGSAGTNSPTANSLNIGYTPTGPRYAYLDMSELLIYSLDLNASANSAALTQLKSYVRSQYGLTVS